MSSNSEKVDFGEMPQVNNNFFENIYVVDENVCNNKSLPATRFAIEYPDEYAVAFPHNKRDHIVIQNKQNNLIIEEISVGFSTIKKTAEDKGCSLIEDIAENLKDQLPFLKVHLLGERSFFGKQVCMFQGEMDYSAYKSQGYEGNYRVLILLPLPETNPDLPGVLFSLIANEKSEIKSFDDFEVKGMIAQVFKSFRYIE